MKPIKRKYKPTIVCDKCHKSIGKTKPSYKKVGEIEYRYWRCRHCSTVYVISATDAELRKKIQEYQEFVDEYKDKEMPQEEMQKAQLILQTNVERSREIKEQYPLTLKPWETLQAVLYLGAMKQLATRQIQMLRIISIA